VRTVFKQNTEIILCYLIEAQHRHNIFLALKEVYVNKHICNGNRIKSHFGESTSSQKKELATRSEPYTFFKCSNTGIKSFTPVIDLGLCLGTFVRTVT
jgi:hypothetical protein